MAAASDVRHPNTSPRPAAASPNAVSWAYTWLFGTTWLSRKFLKKSIGLPSAYLVTRIGITCNQRSEAVGTGKKPHASVTLSFVKIAFANHTPTAIRNPASQRSGERIAGGVPTCSYIWSVSSIGGGLAPSHTAVGRTALGGLNTQGGGPRRA